MCFLNTGNKEYFDFCQEHFDFLINLGRDIVVDPFGNNYLVHKCANSNVVSKGIIRKIIETKDTDLINYRPTELVKKMNKEELAKTIIGMDVETLKSSGLVKRVF